MTTRPIRALLIDFDGTILDTETLEFRVWEEIYHSYGAVLPLPLWADSIGRGVNDIKFDPYAHLETLLQRPLDPVALRTRKHDRLHELIAIEPVRPGIIEYIREAKRLGMKVGVASSSAHDWVDGHLARLGLLQEFDCICCFGDVALAKPYPDLYLLACKTLDIAPSEAVALEDSPNGLWGAKRAGVFAVAFPNPLTSLLDLSHADLRINDLLVMPLEVLLAEIPKIRATQNK